MGKGFDLGGLFKQAQQLQEKIAGVQQELSEKTVEASAGGGMVTAVLNGKFELVRIRLEPSLFEQPVNRSHCSRMSTRFFRSAITSGSWLRAQRQIR